LLNSKYKEEVIMTSNKKLSKAMETETILKTEINLLNEQIPKI